MISDYKIIDKPATKTYDDEVMNDIGHIGQALQDEKNGMENKTSMIVTLQDI